MLAHYRTLPGSLESCCQSGGHLKREIWRKKVVASGSLVDHSRFTYWSDVDLAAWGIPDDRFYAAGGAVTGVSEKFRVDLFG
ncbi:hypothetical protein [Neomoorella thermoacetica]|uniref:hypothetical protein n=1 Tax=Neomoorella thermoacetica TaxID=1525 RepID=UPI001E41BB98|nr:hypothetical protein [Moorella thermoacetica]